MCVCVCNFYIFTESAVKISQPERITPYMQNKSVQKKDGK